MLRRIRHLAEAQQDFAFETTMASRSFAPFLRECKEAGYTVHLLFVWLRSPELAIERVAHRVAAGGHHIPEEVVRRRYVRGIQNFLNLYAPIARTWDCMDNSAGESILVASRDKNGTITVYDADKWREISGTK
jgi:predicted ABC-type ATPase